MDRPSALTLGLAGSILLAIVGTPAATAQLLGERQGRQGAFLPVTARAAALGDAVGALHGSPDGVPSNPAVLSWLTGPSATYSFLRLSRAASLQNLTASIPLGTSSGLGIHLTILHHGEFDFYSRKEIRDRGFELDAGSSWSVMIAEDLSCGLTLSALHATTDADPVWALSADAGLAYAPGRFHRFGLSLRGFGTDYEVSHPVLPPDVPDSRPSRTVSLQAVFDYPLSAGGGRLLFAFENDKLLAREGLVYKAGVEYQPLPLFALRCGIQIREHAVEPRAGAGLAAGPAGLDYAYRYRRGEGPSHMLTLRFPGE